MILERKYRDALLWTPFPHKSQQNVVRCNLCSHYCIIKENETGKCNARLNEKGKLYALNWGMANGTAIEPIEKKPFFHFKPKSKTLSFGAFGCNFACINCQNWTLSQAFKHSLIPSYSEPFLTAEKVVESAINTNCNGIAYTYSEPTIFFEYAYDTIKIAKKTRPNLYHVFVSNGYFSSELIDLIVSESLIDAVNIDLKFINEDKYQKICKASVKPLLKNIEKLYKSTPKIHIEIINLIIPEENDNPEAIEKLSKFIFSLSPDIPLHFNRFYPAYMMHYKKVTPISSLLRAKEIAMEIGLNYVYIGNTLEQNVQNTLCPKCNSIAIERKPNYHTKMYYTIQGSNSHCSKCNNVLPIII